MNIEPNENICPTCGNQNLDTVDIGNDTLKRKAASALANLLAFSLRVPNGKELILLLGNGNEYNNVKAIEHWVLGRITNISHWPLPSMEAEELIRELECALTEILSKGAL